MLFDIYSYQNGTLLYILRSPLQSYIQFMTRGHITISHGFEAMGKMTGFPVQVKSSKHITLIYARSTNNISIIVLDHQSSWGWVYYT